MVQWSNKACSMHVNDENRAARTGPLEALFCLKTQSNENQHVSEKKKHPRIIGWRERVSLPDLGIFGISAKTDTGARSSCLHAFHVEEIVKHDQTWVRFGVHPSRRSTFHEVWCEAKILDKRTVKNSGGLESHRYFIETHLQLGDDVWKMELSLADRETMGYRMLLGRTAIRHQYLVNPRRSFLLSDAKKRKKR